MPPKVMVPNQRVGAVVNFNKQIMNKKKTRKPHEVPRPAKKPEILPVTEPDNPVIPVKEPEIDPGKEPGKPSSPAEFRSPEEVPGNNFFVTY